MFCLTVSNLLLPRAASCRLFAIANPTLLDGKSPVADLVANSTKYYAVSLAVSAPDTALLKFRRELNVPVATEM